MIKYTVKPTSRFKREYKLLMKQQRDMRKLDEVIGKLARGETLEASFRDHVLIGNFTGFHECHIAPDWLLVYQYREDELVLVLARTGSHSNVLRK